MCVWGRESGCIHVWVCDTQAAQPHNRVLAWEAEIGTIEAAGTIATKALEAAKAAADDALSAASFVGSAIANTFSISKVGRLDCCCEGGEHDACGDARVWLLVWPRRFG